LAGIIKRRAANAALAMPASARLLAHKDLSLATALPIATTAIETCKGSGLPSVGDDRWAGGPGHCPAARRRYWPTHHREYPEGIVAGQGALPTKIGDEVIAAVGVSGAPGSEKDEACVKAGLDKVADQLK
jgi:uncharacterized protein GlcG (DUF336 family)